MESKTALIKNVLSGLYEEIDDLIEQVKTKGFVPKEICDLCEKEDKRDIVSFSEKEKAMLEIFRKWLIEIGSISINRNKFSDDILIKTTNKIGSIKDYTKDDVFYI